MIHAAPIRRTEQIHVYPFAADRSPRKPPSALEDWKVQNVPWVPTETLSVI